jgi:serine/threonine-protein kinase TTK/MPS1
MGKENIDMTQPPSSIVPGHTKRNNRRGVLRYGETMESLFRLDANSDPEYRALCHAIVDDETGSSCHSHRNTRTENAAVWRRALELAMKRAKQDTTERPSPSDTTTRGKDLIRLHRRATSRFTDQQQQQQAAAAAAATDTKENEDILAIWLSFAKAQALYGLEQDARFMFRHIQNQRLGERDASLYLALAELEMHTNNPQAARQALTMGMEKDAQPQSLLREALQAYEEELWNAAAHPPDSRDHARTSSRRIPTTTTTESSNSNTSRSAPRRSPKRQLDQPGSSSPTRQKTETGRVDVLGATEEKRTLPSQTLETAMEWTASSSSSSSTAAATTTTTTTDQSKESIKFQLAPLSRRTAFAMEKPSKESMMMTQTDHFTQPWSPSLAATRNSDDATPRSGTTTTLQVKSVRVSSALLPLGSNSRSSRPPLLSKTTTPLLSKTTTPLLSKNNTPRLLSRMSMLGKPGRVDPSQSLDLGSDDDDDSEVGGESSDVWSRPMQKPRSKPRVTKQDLSYIWAWDPDKKSKPQGSRSTTTASTGVAKSPPGNKLEEAASSRSSAGTAETDAFSKASSSSSTGGHHHRHSSKDCLEAKDGESALRGTTPSLEQSSGAAAVAGCNPAFLSLVSERNMMRVNSIPYAKLGVIGKGGSCKVYRVLSKDCTVLAVKKVKLEGMEKKTIDGYSNEIALLKRLRGNPAIIQMFDSEVDLQRKAIFLVMELGEVDLSHVLQQQSLANDDTGGSGRRRHLNMNFIRLTWQQMLTAVHSIHEERIIHGDLKPANFLFVRGALKLIDFGIAKAIQSDDTTNIYRESTIGTLNYMSPEAILDTGSVHGARMKIGRASAMHHTFVDFLQDVLLRVLFLTVIVF